MGGVCDQQQLSAVITCTRLIIIITAAVLAS